MESSPKTPQFKQYETPHGPRLVRTNGELPVIDVNNPDQATAESSFAVAGRSKHGPRLVLKNKKPAAEDVEPADATPSPASEVSDRVIDHTQPASNDPDNPGRRGFLRQLAAGGVAVGGASVLGVNAFLNSESEVETPELAAAAPAVTPAVEKRVEELTAEEVATDTESELTAESMLGAEQFAAELEGCVAYAKLAKNEVLFLDADGRPVGTPFPFQNFKGRTYSAQETPEARLYLNTPGKLNEYGIATEGLSGEWLNYAQAEQQAAYPDQQIVKRVHVQSEFASALKNKSEPALIEGVKDGSIQTYKDIVNYFADKADEELGGLTRKEYVQKGIKFSDNLPVAIQEEISNLLPGLCAHESRFNEKVMSKDGAGGIMQFTKETWLDEGGSLTEVQNLVKQVEIAGKYIPKQYEWILHYAGEEAISLLRGKFQDEESFQRELMTPLLINAYNTGHGPIADAIKLYAASVQIDDMPAGKDLYLAIADFARLSTATKSLRSYQDESRKYVTNVYAQAEVLAT